MLSTKQKIQNIILFLAVIWVPLANLFLHIDGAGRFSVYLLGIGCMISFSDIKKYCFKKPITLLIINVIYIYLNGKFKGSEDMFSGAGSWLFFKSIFECPLMMLLASSMLIRDFENAIRWIIRGLLVYCVLILFGASINESGRLNGETINANVIAFNSSITFGFCLLWIYLKKGVRSAKILIAIPALTTILTGSRMGLLSMMVIIVYFILSQIDLKNPKKLFSFLVLSILVFVALNYVLSETVVGDRLQSTSNQMEDSILQTGTFWDYLGDRGFQYYYSWDLFLDNWVTGIGFRNWITYNPQRIVCHSEYLVQYLENGIIAIALYVLFCMGLFKSLLNVKRQLNGTPKIMTSVLLAQMFAVMISNIFLWSYNVQAVFLLYALIFSYPNVIKKNEENRSLV